MGAHPYPLRGSLYHRTPDSFAVIIILPERWIMRQFEWNRNDDLYVDRLSILRARLETPEIDNGIAGNTGMPRQWLSPFFTIFRCFRFFAALRKIDSG
jgi:hypothetical protein